MGATKAPRRRRRGRLQREQLLRYLAPTATTQERAEGILATGISAAELAELTGATESAVRHWLAGGTEPRNEAATSLDYVRAVLKALLESGMEAERALQWLTSLDPAHFGQERPIDVLATTPMRVLTAALELELEAGVPA